MHQAPTDESRLVNSDREAGAETETPALKKPTEVPSRAVRVNAQASSPHRKRSDKGAANRRQLSGCWTERASRNFGGQAGWYRGLPRPMRTGILFKWHY